MIQLIPKILWTYQMDVMIRELAAKGMTGTQIADTLNKTMELPRPATRNAVIGRCHRQGIELHNHSQKPKPQKKKVVVKQEQKKAKPKVAVEKIVLPEPVEIYSDIQTDKKRIIDLGVFDCRWTESVGHPSTFEFCGARKKPGSSYCAEHHARVYIKPPRKY